MICTLSSLVTSMAIPNAGKRAGPNVLSQVGDLLGRSDVDWVLITAPLPERARLALRALEAGKNVALESPPCVDARQLQAMTEAASDARRLLAVLPTRREAVDFPRLATRFSRARSDQLRRRESCAGRRPSLPMRRVSA